MDPLIVITVAAFVLGCGILGVYWYVNTRPTPEQPLETGESVLTLSERLTAMRDRIETAIDAARGAEKTANEVAGSVNQVRSNLGGQITQLKKRVDNLDALSTGLALARSGAFSAGGGDGAPSPNPPRQSSNQQQLALDPSLALEGDYD